MRIRFRDSVTETIVTNHIAGTILKFVDPRFKDLDGNLSKVYSLFEIRTNTMVHVAFLVERQQ